MLPRNVHEAWHTIAGAETPERIAEIINQKFLDPDWKFVAVKRE